MALISEDRLWDVVSVGAAALGAIAVRQALKKSWTVVRRREPPENPASPSVDWGEALAWTLVSGALAGLARLVARRGAAAGWRGVMGDYPRPVEKSRASPAGS